jgi:hypothetical protein
MTSKLNQLLFLVLTVLLCASAALSAINISWNSSVTQNFDSMGSVQIATLPADWKIDKLFTTRTIGTYAAAGTTTETYGDQYMGSYALNGIYNFGYGQYNQSPDRAPGWLYGGFSGLRSGNLYARLYNSGTQEIPSFRISYNVEKYRYGVNSGGFYIQMYYSSDGTNWISAGNDFLISLPPDDYDLGFYHSYPFTRKLFSVSLPANGYLYLAWNYSVTEGEVPSGGQALGIDDFEIIANTHATNQLPVFSNIITSPATGITDSTPVSVSADVVDPDGTVETVDLFYGTDPEGPSFFLIELALVSGNTYTTVSEIPPYPEGTTVYYRINAKDDWQIFVFSEWQSYYVESSNLPSAPTNLSLVQNPTTGFVTLSWDPSSGSPTSYKIVAGNYPDFSDEFYIEYVPASQTSFTDIWADVTPRYFYKVYAIRD